MRSSQAESPDWHSEEDDRQVAMCPLSTRLAYAARLGFFLQQCAI